MTYKRKAKKKEDLRENPIQGVDTSMGKKYLEMGRVVILDKKFDDNRNK